MSLFQRLKAYFYLVLDIQFTSRIMKRNLLITAALLAMLTLINFKANAQKTTDLTPVVATIKILDTYAIVMTDLAVEFDYESQAAFINKSLTKAGHITVFSNRKYKIDVKALDDFKIGSATTNVITSDVLQVSVATPATAPNGSTYAQPFLTHANQNLINLAPAALAASYDIKYAIPDVTKILGTPTGTYTTNIIYTLTQQ